MRLALVLAMCGLAVWGGASAAQEKAAQDSAVPGVLAPLLTLDDERLFTASQFGQALLARQEEKAQTLTAENRRIEGDLEAEEQELSRRRATLSRDEFTPLAEAFNVKVEGIRAAQDAKSRELARHFDEERQRFLQAVRPVLARIMTARGAVAIIDKRAVFVGFENVDITTEAIAELDKAFADGSLAPQ